MHHRRQETRRMIGIYGKRLLASLSIFLVSAIHAFPCDQRIVLSNWKSCQIASLSEEGGDADWKAVPEWTRSKAISPYFLNDPRALANHGLCNAKFHRVVICWPGWDEGDKDKCSYRICDGASWKRVPDGG
ncbi:MULTISPECIES: hypothetical protein [unclassified Rhizobium]|uniref:hypothetical protein n=1 Tax=unclassified Rhizobium TaxID=2613769 RepID=UPI001FED4D09|nr:MULTISPECIES: hypothetical protein [unclassified Rhizobium]